MYLNFYNLLESWFFLRSSSELMPIRKYLSLSPFKGQGVSGWNYEIVEFWNPGQEKEKNKWSENKGQCGSKKCLKWLKLFLNPALWQ